MSDIPTRSALLRGAGRAVLATALVAGLTGVASPAGAGGAPWVGDAPWVGGAPKRFAGYSGCALPSAPVPGTYAGSFAIDITASGQGFDFGVQVSGPLEIEVVAKPGKDGVDEGSSKFSKASGSFTMSLDGAGYGESVDAGAGGTFELIDGDPHVLNGFKVRGTSEAGASAVVSGPYGGGSFTGGEGESVTADFEVDRQRITCTELSGVVAGELVEQTTAGFASQGLRASVSEARWTVARSDDGARRLAEAQEEVRAKASAIAERVFASEGRRPRASDMVAFRQLYEDILSGKYSSSKAKVEINCLLKVFFESYLPVTAKWLEDDLREIAALGKTATTDDELNRLRRLISQSLYRDRELTLFGCSRDGSIAEIGEAAANVARRLVKKGFFDRESVRVALQWGRDAQLMRASDDDAGVMDTARHWASTRYDEALKRLVRALRKTTDPTEAQWAEINELIQDARVAEKDAEVLGALNTGNTSVNAEVAHWCEKVKGGC